MRLRIAVTIAALALSSAIVLWFASPGVRETSSPAALGAELEPAPSASTSSVALPDVQREEEQLTTRSTSTATAEGASDSDLVVRILDARGEAVSDLAILLAAEYPEALGSRMVQLHRTAWNPKGDLPRHGIRVPAAELAEMFAKARDARAANRAVIVRLKPAFPTPACSSFVFPSLEKPASDVELRLATCGFLRIEALDESGLSCADRLLVRVEVGEGRSKAVPAHAWQAIPADGRLRVPLSSQLHVELLNTDSSLRMHRESIAGPETDGAEVSLRVVMQAFPILKGRLISTEGEPLRNQHLWLSLQSLEGASGGNRTLRTDHDGVFRVPISFQPTPQRIQTLRLFPLPEQPRTIDPNQLEKEGHAVLTDVEVPETGQRDVGDVRITRSQFPFIASGIVIDWKNAPVADATVNCRFLYSNGAGGAIQRNRTTNADGEFRILQDAPCSGATLFAMKSGFVNSETVKVAAGTTGVRLVLGEAGVIEGSVRLPEGISPSDVWVSTTPDIGSASDKRELDRDGRFRLEGCPPTSYALELGTDPWPPFRAISDLDVVGPGTLSDLRLKEIDLRDALRALRICAVEANGTPLAQKTLRLSSPRDAFRFREVRTDSEGRATLPVPMELSAVELRFADGFPSLVASRAEEQEVVLAEPLSLELALEREGNLPAEATLAVRLRYVPEQGGNDTRRYRSEVCSFLEGPVTCRVPIAGRYELEWSVRLAGDAAKLAYLEGESSLEIENAASKQSLRLSPPPEALRAALEKLGH